MAYHTLSFWTGPTMVKELAQKFRDAGIVVCIEGTDHVHVKYPGRENCQDSARWNAIVDLQRHHGTDFGLR